MDVLRKLDTMFQYDTPFIPVDIAHCAQRNVFRLLTFWTHTVLHIHYILTGQTDRFWKCQESFLGVPTVPNITSQLRAISCGLTPEYFYLTLFWGTKCPMVNQSANLNKKKSYSKDDNPMHSCMLQGAAKWASLKKLLCETPCSWSEQPLSVQ